MDYEDYLYKEQERTDILWLDVPDAPYRAFLMEFTGLEAPSLTVEVKVGLN